MDLTTPSGPGGSGVPWGISSAGGNNEDVGGAPPSQNILTNSGMAYTAVAPIDSVATVDPSQGTHEYEVFSFAIQNDTGFSWDGFVVEILPRASDLVTLDTPGGGAPGERTPTPVFEIPSDSFSVGPVAHEEDRIFFSLLDNLLADGSGGRVSFSLDVGDVSGFTLRMTPAQVAPEPELFALLALGLAALGFLRLGRS